MKSKMPVLFSEPAVSELGRVEQMTDIRSAIGSILRFPAYKIAYPAVVNEALGQLYMECNRAFGPLVEANREWTTDYQYCVGADGQPVNYLVQIDMVGLSQVFLDAAVGMSVDDVRELLRGVIFEIENSLAMYQILERTFSYGGSSTAFSKCFRASLEEIRVAHGKPIALLAVTEEKYEAMARFEFGVEDGTVSDALVRELSGFDRFFGPNEFRDYLAANGGEFGFLLYVRSSDPVQKMKKPDTIVNHPLLNDPDLRRVIKANTLTFNVDAPGMEYSSRINDTKGYMAPMGMAFEIAAEDDLLSDQLQAHLRAGNPFDQFVGSRLSPDFSAYLRDRGVDPDSVGSGEAWLRFKPMKGAYGCYGHRRGALTDGKLRGRIRRELSARGSYVVQPEMHMPVVVNTTDGQAYQYIDRNILAFADGRPMFLCGFRGLMPADSHEAQQGRIHGNAATIWAEITGP